MVLEGGGLFGGEQRENEFFQTTWAEGERKKTVFKPNEQIRQSTGTPEPDDDLTLKVDAGATYELEMALGMGLPSILDKILIQFASPAGTTGSWQAINYEIDAAEPANANIGEINTATGVGNNNDWTTILTGTIFIGNTSGDFTLLWANDDAGEDGDMRAKSWMTLKRI